MRADLGLPAPASLPSPASLRRDKTPRQDAETGRRDRMPGRDVDSGRRGLPGNAPPLSLSSLAEGIRSVFLVLRIQQSTRGL